jgi:hypothetical protein
MNQQDKKAFTDDCVEGMSQSAMERMLLEEYLNMKGYSLSDLDQLPEDQAKSLMRAACQHASLKMAQVESKVHFRDKIRSSV